MHIDSPRIDVKQNPLYEDTGFAYLDTHYYGGIKKYQWVTIPLAIHGVVVTKNNKVIDVKSKEPSPCDITAPEIIRFNGVTIRYGERTILRDLNWTVRRGEHWALSGKNGSGKSTLLSLVCADNPQRYACDISLFGRKHGAGESIWDIKRRIGYVSPEMHRGYKQNIPALQIVASGLKDTVGLYVRPNEAEQEQCRKWLGLLGVGHLAERRFMEMSSGEQRLVLLARAFVKEPELLILDEPLHGLDDENRRMVKALVDRYCQDPMKTLVYVTHYQEELPRCIDHFISLQEGQRCGHERGSRASFADS